MKTLRFQCELCGYCCRNLLADINGGKGTLFLLPNERKLFSQALIRPLFGSGTKGRSRPRPANIFAYQINVNVCPYIKRDNTCAIYPKRPMMCRAFPFEGIGITVISRHCPTIKKTIREHEIVDQIDAPEEMQANKFLAHYVSQNLGGLLWHFDLDTQKWKIFPSEKIRRKIGLG